MKYKFEESQYAALFSDKESLRTFIDETKILQANFNWWESQFMADSIPTPMDEKGIATFTMNAVERNPSMMMDMRAPLGKGKPADEEGYLTYSASIPNFIAPVVTEQAFERK